MRWARLLGGAIAVGLACLSGCDGQDAVEEMCERACECQSDCTAETEDECVETYHGVRDELEEAGCGEEYDEFALCQAATECGDAVLKACDDEFADMRACQGLPTP